MIGAVVVDVVVFVVVVGWRATNDDLRLTDSE